MERELDGRLKAMNATASVRFSSASSATSVDVDAVGRVATVVVAGPPRSGDAAYGDALLEALVDSREPLARDILMTSVGNEPWKCVGCIVEHVFADLAVANFGAADVACTICSCKNLTETSCETLIQAALYAVIATMPIIAVATYESCKSLCG